MPKQTFEIIRAPEASPVTAEQIRRWLWIHRPDSEWIVEEIPEPKKHVYISEPFEKDEP